jgi:hypothetical protein
MAPKTLAAFQKLQIVDKSKAYNICYKYMPSNSKGKTTTALFAFNNSNAILWF